MADTFTPTRYQDRGDTLVFYDVSGNTRQEPRYSDKAALYLRRLGAALPGDLTGAADGTKPSVPTDIGLKSVSLEISANDIASLHSVAKTIVPAQGEHKRIQIVAISIYMQFQTTVYSDASNADLLFYYKDSTGPELARIPVKQIVINNDNAVVEVDVPTAMISDADDALWINQPVVAMLSAAILLGDSPLQVKVVYIVDDERSHSTLVGLGLEE